ncbi:MAG: ATP-binding cassette domain-containing protein [Lachnospiraceae bacterium]|nr:ATP-binding cassette domain-containing protein [Lachnospiraceae bacterium]
MRIKTKARKAGILLFWLIVWQLAAIIMENEILLVGPVEVFLRLISDGMTVPFWNTVIHSLFRIITGFLGAFALGSLFGILAYRYSLLQELLEPLMSAVKSVPVASFVVILLIWFGAERLSIWVAFLIVLPNLYFQVLEGLHATDRKLLEMGKVYGVSAWNRAWYIYRPALRPFLMSGCKVSVGMAWKSGVAAEIIGLPAQSVGERIYMSKIYLDTAGVLSWTVVCIILSFLVEKIFLSMLARGLTFRIPMWNRGQRTGWESETQDEDRSRIGNRAQSEYKNRIGNEAENEYKSRIGSEHQNIKNRDIIIENLTKSYGSNLVLQGENFTLESGKIYAFMNPSGTGKTTLLRILAGLESFDSGSITGLPQKVGMIFQENTCIQSLDALGNMELICGPKEEKEWERLLREVGLSEIGRKTMGQFSGGMVRRVEILRCLLSDRELLLMDEPFNGLDEENRRIVIDMIHKYQRNRTIVMTTHKIEEAREMKAEIGTMYAP